MNTTTVPGRRWFMAMRCLCQSRVVFALTWLAFLSGLVSAPRLVAMSDPGDFLVRNTARFALVWWAIAAAMMIRRYSSLARETWTFACVAFLIHVAMAFEHAHHWSHSEAFRHVEAVSGYGAGIFVSYSFTLMWSMDVLWWWVDSAGYRARARWIGWTLHGFMVFVIVNATVVFEAGPTRWVGAIGLVALAFLLCAHRAGRMNPKPK